MNTTEKVTACEEQPCAKLEEASKTEENKQYFEKNKIVSFESVEDTPFNVVTNEKNEYVITINNRQATTKKFKTTEEAKEYIYQTDWYLINALICETIEYFKTREK